MRSAAKVGAVIAVVGLAGLAWLRVAGDRTVSPEGPATQAPERAHLVAVARQPLTQTMLVPGRLTYGGRTPVFAQFDGPRQGVVTALPGVGKEIRIGERLFEIDGRPVILLPGARPAWRSLGPSDSAGPDIAQLQDALTSLGFGRGLAGASWDPATSVALRQWQASVGAQKDGVVDLGEAVFLPGAARVLSIDAQLGARVAGGSQILTVSTGGRIAEAAVGLDQVGALKVGDSVGFQTPTGQRLGGTVVTIGIAATQDESRHSTIPVTVSIEDANSVPPSDTSVSLAFSDTLRAEATVVPVSALLANVGGSYDVEVVRQGARVRVPIEIGLLADGLAEVTAGEIAPGDMVVVPD